MGSRDLLEAGLDAIKNGLAAPHPALAVDGPEDLFIPVIPGIDEKAVGLGQHGRPQELRIQFETRADPKADSTENAVDIGVDLSPFLLIHRVFEVG